jgi:hypothetical protein
VSWEHKKCICKICKEKNNGNGEEPDTYRTIHEGKRHLFLFHQIPFSKGREFLEIAQPKRHRVIITKLGRI